MTRAEQVFDKLAEKGATHTSSLSKSEQLIEKNAGNLMDKWKAKAEAKARKRHEAGKHVFNKKYRNQFAQEDLAGSNVENAEENPAIVKKPAAISTAESTESNVTSDPSGVGLYEGESVEVGNYDGESVETAKAPKVMTPPKVSYEGESLERGHRLSQSNIPPSNPATNPRVTRESFKNPTSSLSEAFKNPQSRLSKKYKDPFKKEAAVIIQKSFIRGLINEVSGEE
jgi:hypothetical protein